MYRKVVLTSLLLASTSLSSVPVMPKEPTSSTPAKLNSKAIAAKTGAGVFHYADGHVLLGLRDDEECWCNFGGESDGSDATLAATASRETREESNGYFAHHPHDITNLPFIDTIQNGLLYRMYFKKLPNQIDPKSFRKAQETATAAASKEYRDFKWIPIQNIMNAILVGKAEISLGEEKLNLFEPLFQTLSTPAGKWFLRDIAYSGNVETFSKWTRFYLNRTYLFDRPAPATAGAGAVAEVPVFEDTEAQLAYAVAAHSAALVEMKSKWPQTPDVESVLVEGWNAAAPLSLTQIHLRKILGTDYVTKEAFSMSPNPQRSANLANLETFLNKYLGTDEFKRPATYTAQDLQILADMLDWEEQHRSLPTFYHATSADVANLWKSFTFLRELLTLTSLAGNKVIMRGTDIYFKGFETIEKILKEYGTEDYQKGRQNLLLCLNYVLTAGLKTTNTSSSSIEYFLNNHAVQTPDIARRFEEAMALMGIPTSYEFFTSLFAQYHPSEEETSQNSVVVSIATPPHLLEEHAYAAWGGGAPYSVSEGDTFEESTVLKDLTRLQNTDLSAADETSNETTKISVSEARLNLHPHVIHHPAVQMKMFERFPLNENAQKEFNHEMRKISIAMMADWLKSKHMIMPGSFMGNASGEKTPFLKQLFAQVWKGPTEKALEEIVSYDAFHWLLENGQVEAAQAFLDQYPETLEHIKPTDIKIQKATVETLKFFLEKVAKKSVKEFFETPKAFYRMIRINLAYESPDVLDYLLSEYDLSTIDPKIVKAWYFQAWNSGVPQTPHILAKHFPDLKHGVLQKTLESRSVEAITHYIQQTGGSPVENLKELLTQYKTNNGDITLQYTLKEMDIDLSTLTLEEVRKIFQAECTPINWGTDYDALIAKGISPSTIAEMFMGYIRGNYAFASILLAHIQKYNLNVADINNFSVPEFLGNFPSLSTEDTEALVKAGIPAKSIAEAMVEGISLGKYKTDHLFDFIKKFNLKIEDIGGFNASEFLESFHYLTDTDINYLIESGIPAESIAAALIKRARSGKYSAYELSMFLQKYAVKIKTISGFDMGIFTTGFEYIFYFPEALIKSGVPAAEIFNAGIQKLLYSNSTEPISYFVHNNRSALQELFTPDELQALNNPKNDVFLNLLKERYPAPVALPTEEVPSAAAAERIETVASTALETVEEIEAHNTVEDEESTDTESSEDSTDILQKIRGVSDQSQLQPLFSKVFESNDEAQILAAFNNIPAQFVGTLESKFSIVTTILTNPSVLTRLSEEVFSSSVRSVIDYLGDLFPAYSIQNSLPFFELVEALNKFNKEKLRELWTKFPDLFTYQDEAHDQGFFERMLSVLDGELLEEFVLLHAKKLGELANNGCPYFWEILYVEADLTDGLIDFINAHPELLELKSIEGFSFKEALDILDVPATYEKIMKKLRKKTGKK